MGNLPKFQNFDFAYFWSMFWPFFLHISTLQHKDPILAFNKIKGCLQRIQFGLCPHQVSKCTGPMQWWGFILVILTKFRNFNTEIKHRFRGILNLYDVFVNEFYYFFYLFRQDPCVSSKKIFLIFLFKRTVCLR